MHWFKARHGENDTKDKTASFVHNRTRENIKSGEKHSTIFGKIARYFEDLKLVAFTGSYNDLTGKPQTMAPTAHNHTKSQISDFPTSMTPTAHKHTKADITNFPASLPASDVPAWAKAASKPSYNWNEIGGKPSTFPPASHTHDYAAPDHSHSSYAPKADPFFTGTVSLNTYAKIASVYSNQITLYTGHGGCTNEDGVSVSSNTDGTSGIYGADNRCTCGGSNVRWKQVYAVSSTISTSDKREKYDISYIGSDSHYDTCMTDEMLVKFIMGLAPVVFKRINGDSGRPHHGIISQDFETLMEDIGLSDHAAFIKSPVTIMAETEIKDENGDIHLELVEKVIPGEYRYGMRYEELITDAIRFCQILYKRNAVLEKTLQEQQEKTRKLEEHIEVLEKTINQGA